MNLRRVLFGVGLALAMSAAPLRADEGMARLQGVWAPKEAVLDDRLSLWEGTALYLMASGRGALVGAGPLRDCDGQRCAPRIGVPVRLVAEAAAWRLTMEGSPALMRLRQDADGVSLLLQGSEGKELRLQRRSTELPADLRRALGGASE